MHVDPDAALQQPAAALPDDVFQFRVHGAPVQASTTEAEVVAWYEAENARLVSELKDFFDRQIGTLTAQMQRDFARLTSH